MYRTKSALNWKGWSTIGFVIAAAALAIFSMPRLESTGPMIAGPAILPVGTAGADLELELQDLETGLRSVHLKIVHRGGGQVVFEEEFPGSVFTGADVPGSREVKIFLDPKVLRLADGPATLIVTARDWSWRNSGSGNRSEINVQLAVDTKAPRVRPSGGLIYIYRGGAAAATYWVDEATASDGVWVGDRFYSGYPVPGTSESDGQRVAFFAVAVHAPADPVIEIQATDRANNSTRVRLRTKVFERRFPELETVALARLNGQRDIVGSSKFAQHRSNLERPR